MLKLNGSRKALRMLEDLGQLLPKIGRDAGTRHQIRLQLPDIPLATMSWAHIFEGRSEHIESGIRS
jgi:hypothetical protein